MEHDIRIRRLLRPRGRINGTHCAPGILRKPLREAAIAKAYLRPEMVVADMGTGTGFMAAGLAPLVSQVYALDGSPAMLEVARRNLAGFANVVYRCPTAAPCRWTMPAWMQSLPTCTCITAPTPRRPSARWCAC